MASNADDGQALMADTAMNLSRRKFLTGLLATAALPAIPVPLPEIAPSIFEGAIGVYNGVVIRSVLSLDDVLRAKRHATRNHIKPNRDGYYVQMVGPSWARALRVQHFPGGVTV